MSEEESNWTWVGPVLFFAVGTSTGLWAAADSIERGEAVGDSILFGASYGTAVAWFGFFIAYHGFRVIRRMFRGHVT